MSSIPSDTPPRFLRRRLNAQSRGSICLLDAVRSADDKDPSLAVYFTTTSELSAPVRACAALQRTARKSVGGAQMLQYAIGDEDAALHLRTGAETFELEPARPEQELFCGMNAAVATRNGEPAALVVDWLRYHAQFHGLEAAVIVDRSQPGTAEDFAEELKAGVARLSDLKRVVLLDAAVPLGKPDLPAEAHPFNAPNAPGKDRMTLPPADPWAAPLSEILIYEITRARFLNTARAVINIDLHDLLIVPEGPSVFDRAAQSSAGCLVLEGQECYPWRVRKGQTATFGDHICVQFDHPGTRIRWCVAPAVAGPETVWRLRRVAGTRPQRDDTGRFYRFMALRHPTQSISTIVAKTSLVEDPRLRELAVSVFGHKPVGVPAARLRGGAKPAGHTAIVTTMKNEGPFILEWIAYHRAIGVQDFLVYTNDCTDGTDELLDLLQTKGVVAHRENPFRKTGAKPQHAALKAAEKEEVIRDADWVICMDVDEYLNIHAGDGTLRDLYDAIGDANMISVTWRLFGNADIHQYDDRLICDAFTRCAPEFSRKPHQAWGFKTLFRNLGIYKKLGVHRPKGLKPQLWDQIKWVNGSGRALPKAMFRNSWRSTTETYGYDLVTLNHYAVRSAESFLVKRDRGRVNHVERDQGLSYWFRMNNNAEEDRSIQRMLPALRAELKQLMADPEIAAAHGKAVAKHREKIDDLRRRPDYAALYDELTSNRMERLSRMHKHFGANVFLAGPDVIPDAVLRADPRKPLFFTVRRRPSVS